MVQLCQLPVGHHRQQHVPLGLGVAGLGVQHRAAPVQHPQDDAADLVVLFAEDLHLDLGVAHHRHLFQNDGVEQHQQDAVEDLLLVGKDHLADEDEKIQQVHHRAHRQAEVFVQHDGRDVHAAAGGPRADHQPDGHADEHAGEDGAQHGVTGEAVDARDAGEQVQEQRIAEGGQRCVEGEPPAHGHRAHHEHDDVGHQHEPGHRHVQPVAGGQRQTRCAAGDEPAGQHEHVHRQGVQRVAQQHQQNVFSPCGQNEAFHGRALPSMHCTTVP